MIKIYKVSDYTKTGKLKKIARPVFVSNVDESEDVMRYNDLAATLEERDYNTFESPYFFSHIKAYHPVFGSVTIIQEIVIGKDRQAIICSPTKLYDALVKEV